MYGSHGLLEPRNVTREDLKSALAESVPHFTMYFGAPMAASPNLFDHLASAIGTAIDTPPPGILADERRGAGQVMFLPLNLADCGLLAGLRRHGEEHRCVAIRSVGPGRFEFGTDNAIFGRWNSLVAVRPCGRTEVLAAHGGEIIPGRLSDHLDRIRQNLDSGTNLPVQVDMDISMACASACAFCFSSTYRASRKDGRLMSTSLLMRLIRQWADQGVRVMRFDGGGDPLTHPDLPAAVEECAGLGLRTAVLTAGDLLRPEQFGAFLRGRTYVRVSLNAASDRTRRTLHGLPPGSTYGIDRVLSAVSALAAAREEEYGTRAHTHMPLGATSMIHPANADETVAIAQRAKDTGFDHLSFRVILGEQHRVRFTDEARRRLADAFATIRSDVADSRFQVFLPSRDLTDQGYVPAHHFDRCRSCTHRALVEVGPAPGTAALVPCGRYRGHGYRADDGDRRVVFGYLDERTDVAQAWMNRGMTRLVQTFPHACGDCIDRSANTFLAEVERILAADRAATFHPFWTADPGGEQ